VKYKCFFVLFDTNAHGVLLKIGVFWAFGSKKRNFCPILYKKLKKWRISAGLTVFFYKKSLISPAVRGIFIVLSGKSSGLYE